MATIKYQIEQLQTKIKAMRHALDCVWAGVSSAQRATVGIHSAQDVTHIPILFGTLAKIEETLKEK